MSRRSSGWRLPAVIANCGPSPNLDGQSLLLIVIIALVVVVGVPIPIPIPIPIPAAAEGERVVPSLRLEEQRESRGGRNRNLTGTVEKAAALFGQCIIPFA